MDGEADKMSLTVMTRITKLLVGLSFLFFLTSIFCAYQESPPDPSQETQTETRSPERIEYQKKVEARLRRLNRQVEALKKQASQRGEEARKQLDVELKELDRKQAAAEQELKKLKNSSGKAWQDLKPGLEAAMKDLEAAFKRAASEFN